MKRLLFLVVLVMMVVVPVAALSLTFQDSGEFASYISCGGAAGTCSYYQSSNGGNSYVSVNPTAFSDYYIINSDPSQTTYAAATVVTANNPKIELFDAVMATLYETNVGNTGRVEIKIVGGKAYIYQNGALFATSGVLAQNPSYVGFGAGNAYGFGTSSASWDDLVYGTTENRYIFGAPEQGYFIKKDLINPATSGFCFPNGTIISSYNMTTTWGVGDSNASQTVQLKEWSSGVVSGTYTTPAGSQGGSVAWPIYDNIINNPGSDYGYYVTTIAGSGSVSEVIPYVATGASVAFDRSTYARGDTAVITYSVDGGGYWDTVTYSYRLDTLDVYGNVIDTQTVTTQTGSKSVMFTSSDSLGIYYAVLIAEPGTGSDIWMNFDSTELTGYLVLTGNVYDAETEAYIPVADIRIGQDTTWYNKTTSADGNYTTNSAFVSGATISINVTSAGYFQYTDSFTPLEGKTIGLNFTLIPTTASVSGVTLAGVTRDSVYGRPINGVTVTITNSTNTYSDISNSVGFYQIADLVDGTLYFGAPTKTGYSGGTFSKAVYGV